MRRERRRDFTLLLGGVALGILGNAFVEFFMRFYDYTYPEVDASVLLITQFVCILFIGLEIFAIYRFLE